MAITRLALLFIFTWFFFPALAQDRDADTVKREYEVLYPHADTVLVSSRSNPRMRPVKVPGIGIVKKANYWRTWLSFGVNVNQGAFSNNWSGGGVNSLALGGIFNYKTDYTRDDKNYVTEIILQYGKLKNKDQLERKTTDRIFWDHKVGLKLSKSWNFFGSLNFESQFDKGYSYSKNKAGDEVRTLISRFMSPGYLTESLGFEYKPNKSFWLRIGTGTARQTFVLDTALQKPNNKNFGVPKGNHFRNELAFQLVTNLEREIMPNLGLKSRYTMFANYEKLGNIDQRLDLTLNAKVNKLINVSLSGIAIYDDDASNKIQASQSLALGIMFKIAPTK
jgi:hypothetical protein